MKGPVQSVELAYLVHSTEDSGKLSRAVEWALGGVGEQEVETLEGHFGNPILSVKVRALGEEAARAAKSLASKIPAKSRDKLEEEIDLLVDEHSALFLRFDKQRLVEGALVPAEGDSVRVKVKPRGFLPRTKAREFYVRILEGS